MESIFDEFFLYLEGAGVGSTMIASSWISIASSIIKAGSSFTKGFLLSLGAGAPKRLLNWSSAEF
jgi:hypothetical protein